MARMGEAPDDPGSEAVVRRLNRLGDELRQEAAARLKKPVEQVTMDELRGVWNDWLDGPLSDEARFEARDWLMLRDKTVNYDNPEDVRAYCRQLEAESDIPWCATRLAMLYAGMGDEQAASKWWQHAAALGDRDAIGHISSDDD